MTNNKQKDEPKKEKEGAYIPPTPEPTDGEPLKKSYNQPLDTPSSDNDSSENR